MWKLKEVNGFERTTLDKLPGIRADLVRLDDNLQEWGFGEMVEALRRNPAPDEDGKSNHRGGGYSSRSGKLLHGSIACKT